MTNSGDLNRTEVYYWDGQKIVETRDGSANVVQQFIHGTQYIDELVMMRRKAESRRRRDEGESPAIGKADRDVRVRATTCPKQASTKRVREGKGDVYVHQDANWNVVALTDLGGSVVERYVYTPYGEVTVHQNTSWGDYDGDGDVDANDKAAMLASPPGICRGASPAGACRLLDLDFDNDVDSNDETKFDALTAGTARHPGLTATGIEQPMAHQGLLFEPEIGSYQNRARQYAPADGRFVQRDPFGLGLRIYISVPFETTDVILSTQNLLATGLTAFDQSGFINSYCYQRSSVPNEVDPAGLASTPCERTCLANYPSTAHACGPTGFQVPDSPGGFPFASCCRAHDCCYGCCAGRLTCEARFRRCLGAVCGARPLCIIAALFYGGATYLFGPFAYQCPVM